MRGKAPKSPEHRAKIRESVLRVMARPEVRERVRINAKRGREALRARTCVYCGLNDYRFLVPDGEDLFACANADACEARIAEALRRAIA